MFEPVTLPGDMTVAESLAAIGMADLPDSSVMVMSVERNVIKHHWLTSKDLPDLYSPEALYVASGTFTKGTLSRKRENLQRIVWLPFDADLFDHQNVSPDERADFRDIEQEEIDALIVLQQRELEDAFARIDIPIHRIDYTGYGLAAYVYLDVDDQTRVSDAIDIHKAIVEQINSNAGYHLIDPQCVDPGTRVTRIPGSYNNKGSTPRQVRTIRYDRGATAPLGGPGRSSRNRPVDVPTDGPGLSDDQFDRLLAVADRSHVDGQRHAMGVAISGWLAKSGVPENQASAFITALARNDKRPSDRTRAVKTSYDRIRSGAPVQGYTALQRLVPAQDLALMVSIMDGFRDRPRSGKVTLSSSISLATRTDGNNGPTSELKIAPFPEECFRGWMSDYRDMVAPLCGSPDQFHCAVGHVLIGSTMGRFVANRYVSKSVYPNVYGLLLGPAGSAFKDKAIEIALELPTALGYDPQTGNKRLHLPPFALTYDVSSGEAIVSTLKKHANVLLYITEFEEMIDKAKRQGTTIISTLTKAWNAPPSIQNITKREEIIANEPFLNLIAAVQPGVLAEKFTQAEINNGFATRWLIFPGDGKPDVQEDPPDINEQSAWELYRDLIDIRQQYVERAERIGREVRLDLTPQAKDLWTEWFRKDRVRPIQEEDVKAMKSRLSLHTRKAALTYAIADGAWEINDQHLEAAIALIEWCWSHTVELMKSWGATPWNELELKIERTLANGPLRRRDLQHATRGRRWGSREFAQVVRAMIENGTIDVDQDGVLSWSR